MFLVEHLRILRDEFIGHSTADMNAISRLHQLATNCATADQLPRCLAIAVEIDQEKSSKFHLTEIRVHFVKFREKCTTHVGTRWITATHRGFFFGLRGCEIGFALLNAPCVHNCYRK